MSSPAPSRANAPAWNKAAIDGQHPSPNHVRIFTENHETGEKTLICTCVPRLQLFGAAPNIREFLDIDFEDIVLPDAGCVVDDDTVFEVIHVITSPDFKDGKKSFRVRENPLAYIRMHVVLVLFGLQKQAIILQERFWDLFTRYELGLCDVVTIWEWFGDFMGESNARVSSVSTYVPPFADFYVQVMAWQLLNLQMEDKLNEDIVKYICGDGGNIHKANRRLKALIEERYNRCKLSAGCEQPDDYSQDHNRKCLYEHSTNRSPKNSSTPIRPVPEKELTALPLPDTSNLKLNLVRTSSGLDATRWKHNASTANSMASAQQSSSEDEGGDENQHVAGPASCDRPSQWDTPLLTTGPFRSGFQGRDAPASTATNGLTGISTGMQSHSESAPNATLRGSRATLMSSPTFARSPMGGGTADKLQKEVPAATGFSRPNPFGKQLESQASAQNPFPQQEQVQNQQTSMQDTSHNSGPLTPFGNHTSDWGFQNTSDGMPPALTKPPEVGFGFGTSTSHTLGFGNTIPTTAFVTPTPATQDGMSGIAFGAGPTGTGHMPALGSFVPSPTPQSQPIFNPFASPSGNSSNFVSANNPTPQVARTIQDSSLTFQGSGTPSANNSASPAEPVGARRYLKPRVRGRMGAKR